MDIIQIFFIAILFFSLISNFLSIPGNFIVFLNTLWYGFATNFVEISLSFLITLLIIAITVEFLEYLVISFGARKYGATKLGVVAAILGGIGGSISGFFFSPVIGALIGGFLRGKNLRNALYATLGALLGRVGGLSIKAIGSVTMVVIVANKIFF
jgi:uncharacterized protein YqgC (DUF456 family)